MAYSFERNILQKVSTSLSGEYNEITNLEILVFILNDHFQYEVTGNWDSMNVDDYRDCVQMK